MRSPLVHRRLSGASCCAQQTASGSWTAAASTSHRRLSSLLAPSARSSLLRVLQQLWTSQSPLHAHRRHSRDCIIFCSSWSSPVMFISQGSSSSGRSASSAIAATTRRINSRLLTRYSCDISHHRNAHSNSASSLSHRQLLPSLQPHSSSASSTSLASALTSLFSLPQLPGAVIPALSSSPLFPSLFPSSSSLAVRLSSSDGGAASSGSSAASSAGAASGAGGQSGEGQNGGDEGEDAEDEGEQSEVKEDEEDEEADEGEDEQLEAEEAEEEEDVDAQGRATTTTTAGASSRSAARASSSGNQRYARILYAGAANSSSSSSSSSSGSSSYGRAWPDFIHALRAVPYNGTATSSVPRLPILPLVPVSTRPGLPGSIFRWQLDADNSYIRRVLERQIKEGSPYLGLFLYRKPGDTELTVQRPQTSRQRARKAAAGKAKEAKEAKEVSSSSSSPQSTSGGDGEKAALDEEELSELSSSLSSSVSKSSGGRHSHSSSSSSTSGAEVDLKDYDEVNKVHRFGVLAEFRVVGDFVSIICHRRIEIEGVAPVQAKIIMVNVRHHDELGPDPLSAPEADTAAATPAASSSSSASPSPSSSARPPYTYEISAYTGMIRQSLAEFLKSEEMQKRARSFTTPFVELSVAGHLCDYAASLLSSDPDTLQDVLSTLDLRDRCYKVVTLCQHEQRTEAARRRLREKVAVSPDYGSEYMKGQKRLIERTLGGKDNRQAVVQRFLQRLEGRTVPPAVRKVIDEEAEKLGGSDNEGSEYSITRNYLDWLTSIPYGVYSAENRDIAKAEQILDADHYGMLDIKQRILEFIATTSRAGREAQQGKIICLTGAPGVGKCWAAGTQLRLMDGQLKAVEKFTGGELLMGDDGSARLVVAGSLTRGRAVLYRIRPSWDGASAFTVNGDHILVLVNAVRPHVAFDAQLRRWETRWFELDTDNEMSQRRQAADSEEAAEEEASRQQRLFAPLEWEVSVDQFVQAPAAVREACKLFQSAAVSFQSSLPSLQSTLSELLGTEPSEAQLQWASWYLGLWSRLGAAGDSSITLSTSASASDIAARLLQSERLFSLPVRQLDSTVQFDFAGQAAVSIASRLLSAYGVLPQPDIPKAWLCDSLDVRRFILAGAMDAEAALGSTAELEINAGRRSMAAAYKELAGSLGIRSSGIRDRVTTAASGEAVISYAVALSTSAEQVTQHCAVSRFQRLQSAKTDASASDRSFGFSIDALAEDDYYGFAVSGVNRRFLLSDFTVTHNTSIARSIARALGRQYSRFSVGGMDDVAEIKGHRRTYLGALPGKIVSALKQTGSCNPVILIDEIDKIGKGGRGDPSAALLEVLDPEQNGSFVDHYLDVPLDLSHVLFICTANDAQLIPAPLADRMDFIAIPGYVWAEKQRIITDYIEPSVRRKTGIRDGQLLVKQEAVEELVRWYCREPGMRNLQKIIEKMYGKAALRLARAGSGVLERVPLPIFAPQDSVIEIDRGNLVEYAGRPVYTSDSLYDVNPVGVATGLAWTSKGGSLIYVEATLADQTVRDEARDGSSSGAVVERRAGRKGKKKAEEQEEAEEELESESEGGLLPSPSLGRGSVLTTGSLGDVMRESVQIAYTVAKQQLAALQPQSGFFQSSRIHLHLPSGSTPKDGPSAGITLVTALLSLAMNKPVTPNLAMTGELSLTGRVLPIGGVREKFLACKRSAVKLVIVPEENRRDVDELPDFIRDGLEVRYAKDITEVVDWAGLGLREEQAEGGQRRRPAGEEEGGGVEIRGIDEAQDDKDREKDDKSGRKERKKTPPQPKGKQPVVPVQDPPPPSTPDAPINEPVVL